MPRPRRRPGRWAVAAALVIALGGGGVWWALSHQGPAVKYVTTPVDRGEIVSKVTASGTLAASRTVEVSSQISGRLQQILVDFNSQVKKGQVLARLDTQLLAAAREQAQANYVSAEASLRRARVQAVAAERDLRRAQTLGAQQFIPASEVDTARTAAEVARAQVTVAEAALSQARASLRQAEVNMGYAAIISPIDGVVIARNVNVGQTVAASLQAPVLFVLAEDLRRMEIHTSVAEADIGRLKPGMAATFTVDAFPGQPFEARVRQIRYAAQTVQNVVTYDAVLDVPNADGRLQLGMTTNVSFIEDERDDALRVPNAALRFRPTGLERPRRGQAGAASAAAAVSEERPRGEAATGEGRQGRRGGKRVWVLENGKPHPVRVKTGLTDGSYTEIVSGELEEGMPVITDEQRNGGASPAPRRGAGGNNRMPRGL